MRDTLWPTPPASGGTGSLPLRSETNAAYLRGRMKRVFFYMSVIPRGIEYGNRTLHSTQAGDLLGGNGWLRILQHASEMFVANLVLPFRETKKVRISESCDCRAKYRYTFGRSSTASFESVPEP